eukprot:jgi/Astpho2/5842/fgenesh1_pg.00080_%23_84_t
MQECVLAALHLCLLCCLLEVQTMLWTVEMVDNRQLARDALLGLEEKELRVAALAMLYDTSHGAGLQQLVLDLSGTGDLADAVKVFVSEHRAGSSSDPDIRRELRLNRREFRHAFQHLYGLDMGHDQDHRQLVRCQVTWEVMVSGGTVAAHLFPKGYRAWNRRQVCLQYDSLGVLRFRVLSVDLWDRSPAELCEKVDKDGNLKPDKKGQHATEALRSMKFSDLDGKAIFFPENVRQRPYQRVVIAQAADAISTQYDIEKLRPDLEPFCLDVLSDFPKKRENAVTEPGNIDLVWARLRRDLGLSCRVSHGL